MAKGTKHEGVSTDPFLVNPYVFIDSITQNKYYKQQKEQNHD